MPEIVSKPDYGTQIVTAGGNLTDRAQEFFDDIEEGLNDNLLGNQVALPSYTVLELPAVTVPGLIFVSDEAGGSVPAFSDGVNWRRVTDRAIVS